MKTFEELGVSLEIRKAIEEMGYESPMPVNRNRKNSRIWSAADTKD